jgi:hypothetical protein
MKPRRRRWGNGLFGWRQRKKSTGAVSGAVGWRRGRLMLVHGSENQKQGGRLCFFLFKGRERPEEEDETGLGFFVFFSSFLKNCTPF